MFFTANPQLRQTYGTESNPYLSTYRLLRHLSSEGASSSTFRWKIKDAGATTVWPWNTSLPTRSHGTPVYRLRAQGHWIAWAGEPIARTCQLLKLSGLCQDFSTIRAVGGQLLLSFESSLDIFPWLYMPAQVRAGMPKICIFHARERLRSERRVGTCLIA